MIQDLHKQYHSTTVLKTIDIQVEKGEFITLLGPSGCGKSTILRIIAGLTDASAGTVSIDGKNMSNTPPKERQVGMVFQSYALFPNMTVKENVSFGLHMQKVQKNELEQRVQDILQLVHLEDRVNAYPKELSGGQQQRVALARALVVHPKVLLLDEPLSALDAQIRKKLQMDLRTIQQKLEMTMILVTHDQEEAMAVSDRIFIMNQGEIAQYGTPIEIYTKPRNEFVANFIGHYNVFTKEQFEKMTGVMYAPNCSKVAVRPEAIRLVAYAGDLAFKGTARQSVMAGSVIRTTFEGECGFIVEKLNDRANRIELHQPYICYVAKEDVITLL